jgi:hypothetical protein
MKTINSHQIEFSYELLSVLPHAYYLYKKNLLKETISSIDTSCFYFFSPKHNEINIKRSWGNIKKTIEDGIPNGDIHTPRFKFDKSIFPPLYESVKKEKITFSKPSIIITNRYNYEWEKSPINYIDLYLLDKIINLLKNDYELIYINIYGLKNYDDDAEALNLGDYEHIKRYHPYVHTIHDLRKKYNQYTYNELQLRLFAGALRFITSNGGLGVLASYFPGDNIIYSKVSRENDPFFYSFDQIYPQLSRFKCKINTARNETELIQLVKEKWLYKLPHFNILIRTSGRPFYFSRCMESIYKQDYLNWSILVSTDNEIDYDHYIRGHKCFATIQNKYSDYENQDDRLTDSEKKSGEFGIYFGPNLYFNKLHRHCNGDYIIYLDDDDNLYSKNSLKILSNRIKAETNLFVLWRVSFPGRLIPSDKNWGKPPKVKDISGIGYAIPRKYLIDWRPWKRSDYRIAKQLYNDNRLKTVWLDEIITQVRGGGDEDGFGKRDDLCPLLKGDFEKIIIAIHLDILDCFIFELLTFISLRVEKSDNVELIVIYDNIPDATCLSFLSHFKNVKVFYFPNQKIYHGFSLFLSYLKSRLISEKIWILAFKSISFKILDVLEKIANGVNNIDNLLFVDKEMSSDFISIKKINTLCPLSENLSSIFNNCYEIHEKSSLMWYQAVLASTLISNNLTLLNSSSFKNYLNARKKTPQLFYTIDNFFDIVVLNYNYRVARELHYYNSENQNQIILKKETQGIQHFKISKWASFNSLVRPQFSTTNTITHKTLSKSFAYCKQLL